MTLVKIGQMILNFDRVTQVRDLSSATAVGPIVVEFGKGHVVQVHAQAGALKAWLDAHVAVPVAPPVVPTPPSAP